MASWGWGTRHGRSHNHTRPELGTDGLWRGRASEGTPGPRVWPGWGRGGESGAGVSRGRDPKVRGRAGSGDGGRTPGQAGGRKPACGSDSFLEGSCLK